MPDPRYLINLNRSYSQKRLMAAIFFSVLVHAIFIAYFAYHKGPSLPRKFYTPIHMVQIAQPAAPATE